METGGELRNRPKHTVKFFLTGYLEKSNIGGAIYGDFTSKKIWVDRDNTGGNQDVNSSGEIIAEETYAPQRLLLNMNIYKCFNNNFEMFARIENILNDVDPSFRYWPGVEFFFGIKYEFNSK